MAMASTLQLASVGSSSIASTVTLVVPGCIWSTTMLVSRFGLAPLLPPKMSAPVPTTTFPEGHGAVTLLGESELETLSDSTCSRPLTPTWLTSLPSSLSALRFVTFVCELTFMGALPASTCRSRAVAAVLVELLSMSRLGPATLPTSLLMALTVLVFPRSKRAPTPVPARAVEASPTLRARTTARPTRNVVALPNHTTFLKIVFVMSCLLLLGASPWGARPLSLSALHVRGPRRRRHRANDSFEGDGAEWVI